MGAGLLYLAIPRTIAAWASVEAQPAIDKLQSGKAPTPADLARGVSGLERALAWVPAGRTFTDLALLELEQAIRLATGDPAREKLLARAEQHLVDGLAANPANGFAWLRLAVVRELRGTSSRNIASALAQSIDMAPNMRKLWLPRASMILRYWRDFTYEELLAARAQLRSIWEADAALRRPLIQAAVQAEQLTLLSWALGDAPPSAEEVKKIRDSLPPSSAR